MRPESKKIIYKEARRFAETIYRRNKSKDYNVAPDDIDVSLASEKELWQLTMLGVYDACRNKRISENEMREVLAVVIDPPKLDITINSLQTLWEMIFKNEGKQDTGRKDGKMN